MRSLYTRLLTMFVVVLLLSIGGLWRVYVSVSGPALGRMIGGSQAAHLDGALTAMDQGGPAGLREYLQRLDSIMEMPHYLVDETGHDVVSSSNRSSLLQPAPEPGQPRWERDFAVFVTPSRDGRYRLITVAPVPFAFADLAPSLGAVLASVAILFWLIAANLAYPTRRLTHIVHRFGRGEFAVRAPVTRRDEIGQLATAFNDMAGRIETLVTAERRLLQDVSHELRSPLTRLNLAIELSRTAADRGLAADRLQREATRLSDLVATLLEVVRLEGEPGSTPTFPVRLMDVLREAVDSSTAEAERRDVRVQLLGELTGTIDGNTELLRRAFDNVMGNATRYAPAGSVVTVACSTTSAEHVIEVRDSGPGVHQHHLAKLGHPFYRADDSRSSETGGVGLGLAIALRAIHLHRGIVHFSNAEPGLRVTMHIPADDIHTPHGLRQDPPTVGVERQKPAVTT